MSAAPLSSLYIALSLIAAPLVAEAQEGAGGGGGTAVSAARQPRSNAYRPLQADDTVGDLLSHPAFAGFARLLLPWDDRSYDETMRLRDIGGLLPYHSAVDPDDVTRGLNRLIADAAQGQQIHFDFYSAAQKAQRPELAQTGLFFFRGKPGAPYAVVAPGGGFAYVGSVHEGFPFAEAISKSGFNAFVIKYRVGLGGRPATEDLAAAVSYIAANASALGVSVQDYSLWGSSAGARMAAAIGSYGPERFGGATLAKPAAVIMAYTGHSDIADEEPPTFVVVGENDGIAAPERMADRVDALRKAGTDVEYRLYPNVGHGFGLGTGTSAEGWINEATGFWARHIRSGDLPSPTDKEQEL